MKDKIGTFMIASILSSSCVYSARALRLIPEFRNQIQAQQSELSSELQKAPQSATPYKSLSDEEIVNWANITK